ncbi:chloramphenicol O-acetyltransferase [Roseibium sp. TrichSKD4]|uniref:CatB-related O-acetyltransferase n=1 Tax=Roseibium sp. TrichSKD4 TaxID=744980 RepID=UPI0001E56C85|nr:CatB-related O-acetyltransferase [Roseibium sp. TrichSKD4]EFO33189.1 chloramphenicol O-acetyltransferase [Roseibium sp. TrichSKD4]
MPALSPELRFPFNGEPHTVFLKNVISRANIEVGDYTYYNDLIDPTAFEDQNVRYHFDFIGDKLVIGKFCALAQGTTFIMSGANHAMTGFSTYPFHIFGETWREGFDERIIFDHIRGDTVVGNDVWFGTNSTILPGVEIGCGAIIGANAMASKNVPPYAVVVGNPGKVVRLRFEQHTIDRLLEIAWWDWPTEKITQNLDAIRGADLTALEKASVV